MDWVHAEGRVSLQRRRGVDDNDACPGIDLPTCQGRRDSHECGTTLRTYCNAVLLRDANSRSECLARVRRVGTPCCYRREDRFAGCGKGRAHPTTRRGNASPWQNRPTAFTMSRGDWCAAVVLARKQARERPRHTT